MIHAIWIPIFFLIGYWIGEYFTSRRIIWKMLHDVELRITLLAFWDSEERIKK